MALQADDLATLRDETATPEVRTAACRRLLAAPDARTQQAVLALLAPGGAAPTVQDLVVREIEADSSANPLLLQPLTELYRATSADRQPAVLRACASIRTRESIRFLLSQGQSEGSTILRHSALAALVRLTGRADLGTDFAAWSEWFASVQWLPEHEWRRVLAEGLARRSDDLAAGRARTVHRLVESERQRALEMASLEARSAVLASLLGDDLPELRRLGIELTNRELANARTPTAAVGAAAVALISDPTPEFRIAGADLVDRLVPPGAPEAVADALLRETDPAVAAALLRQVQRAPTGLVRPVVLRWLQVGGLARAPALEATCALLDAGQLSSPDDRWAVLGVLRSIALPELTAAGLRLLVDLGGDEDRIAVGKLLTADDPAVRQRAAQAACSSASMLDTLLESAGRDPALFAHAAAGVTKFRPGPGGFQSLAALPAPSAEVRTAALVGFGDRLSDGQVISVATRVQDPALREVLLARFANKPIGPTFETIRGTGGAGGRAHLPGGPLENFHTVAGMLVLARTRLEVHKPAAALTLLEALEPVAGQIDPRVFSSLRAVAMICLNRLDELETGAVPMSDWLDALGLAADLPHAPAILQAIDQRAADLTPAESDRLRMLRARIGTTTPASDGHGAAPPRSENK